MSFIDYLKKYKRFLILLLVTILLFTSFTIISIIVLIILLYITRKKKEESENTTKRHITKELEKKGIESVKKEGRKLPNIYYYYPDIPIFPETKKQKELSLEYGSRLNGILTNFYHDVKLGSNLSEEDVEKESNSRLFKSLCHYVLISSIFIGDDEKFSLKKYNLFKKILNYIVHDNDNWYISSDVKAQVYNLDDPYISRVLNYIDKVALKYISEHDYYILFPSRNKTKTSGNYDLNFIFN